MRQRDFSSGTWIAIVTVLYAAEVCATEFYQIFPTGQLPNPRGGHSVVYDAQHNRMILFGGSDEYGNPYHDVWVLSDANGIGSPAWTELHPTGTPPLGGYGQSAVYDSTDNRLIAFAANPAAYSGIDNSVYVLTNANGLGGTPEWVWLQPVGSPPAPRRYLNTLLVYDSDSNRLLVFGGLTGSGPANDLWALTHANGLGGTPEWLELLSAGALGSPPPRPSGGCVLDSQGNAMTLFGGGWAYGFFNDLWQLSGANGVSGTPTWSPIITSTPPSIRADFLLGLDPLGSNLVLFGGVVGDGSAWGTAYFNDLWILSHADGSGGTPEWTQLDVAGSAPVPRDTRGFYDPTSDRVVFFGGQAFRYGVFMIFNDTWIISEATGVPRDTTPPSIADAVATPSQLWPPNHKMRDVVVSGVVWDAIDPAPTFRIVGVSSNEGSSADWDVTGDLTLQLRAERSGSGSGRIYTIVLEAKDVSGNAARTTVAVTVPHNQ